MNDIDQQELKALTERIISSGELGRSRTYSAILNYLVDCSIKGESPKEMAIAVDVLGREADFDVGKDSIVRVHIYHLRNKLKAYFAKHGKTEKIRLEIPKGQYIIVTSLNEQEEKPALSLTGRELKRGSFSPWLAGLVLLVLAVDLYTRWTTQSNVVEPANSFVVQTPWQAILDDSDPVLIVVGDYYIMGEIDAGGNVNRMVREFEINSSEELRSLQSQGEGDQYFNLDLSYIPTSSAYALSRVMRVFGTDAERVSVKMMSELNTADLVNNHIVYLGYLSGLGSLNDLMFADSDLSIGATYDELFNLETDDYFSSSSGLSVGGNTFQDYGMFSTFPSPNGKQFVLIAGMRDEGLINLAEQVTDMQALQNLEQQVATNKANRATLQPDNAAGEVAYEALYEVFGFDNTNFDAQLVYSRELNTTVIWETRLMQ